MLELHNDYYYTDIKGTPFRYGIYAKMKLSSLFFDQESRTFPA